MKELIIPPSVAAEKNAVEMARIRHANGKQRVSLNAQGWKDTAAWAWGLLLVDVASHGRIEGPFGVAKTLGINPHTLRAPNAKTWNRLEAISTVSVSI